MNDPQKFRAFIEAEAKALGFDSVGIAKPDSVEVAGSHLKSFVNAQRHGTMTWMEETMERRADPRVLWSDVKSIILLTMNYGPENNPLAILDKKEQGAISVYARHRDYHELIKGRLKTLASKLVSKSKENGVGPEVKVFVDTAPVMEKPLAQKAGLGWQGKHTNLVSRDFGSWLFLGSIFLTLDLPADEPEGDHCGNCNNCLDVCPTNAFPAPYQLDARRCISYLTIENKGPIPGEFRKAIGNRIYGCDDCLAVCPWNKFADIATEIKLAAPDEVSEPLLQEFLQLDDASFRKRFSGSPVKRIGRNRFMRNCLVAAGNSNCSDLLPFVEHHRTDEDAVVRDAADWARRELEKL
ncbi:MAG: tRNA epoxyqueuosine(34) reductase QueG [Rhizobiaceae bacterium]